MGNDLLSKLIAETHNCEEKRYPEIIIGRSVTNIWTIYFFPFKNYVDINFCPFCGSELL